MIGYPVLVPPRQRHIRPTHFRFKHQRWRLRFCDEDGEIDDLKGLHFYATLLQEPMRPVIAEGIHGFDRAVLGGESVPQAVIDKQGLDEAIREVDLLTRANQEGRREEGSGRGCEIAKERANCKPA